MIERRGARPPFLYRPVVYSSSGLKILDQTALPFRVRYLRPTSAAGVAKAIRRLAVRGAPSIGVAAAYGLAIEARRLQDRALKTELLRAARMLTMARPTAVNLSWAVARAVRLIEEGGRSPSELRRALVAEARLIEAEEVEHSHAIARHGARLVRPGAVILTICNTGPLAAPGLGTALGVILQSHLDGKKPLVYVCETRPLLQGARLTTTELRRAGVRFELIVDSAAASVIERCDMVIAGADRIARNGDTANKVGTRMLAVLARHARKPLYIAAPSSSFDACTATGRDIPIEERDSREVRRLGRCRVATDSTPVFNPAFDITPGRLITAFITEHGIIRPPFGPGIKRSLRPQVPR